MQYTEQSKMNREIDLWRYLDGIKAFVLQIGLSLVLCVCSFMHVKVVFYGSRFPPLDTFTFSRRFYPKRLIQAIHFVSTCVPWESNPWPFALLTQCSTTTEPQEHYSKYKIKKELATFYFTIQTFFLAILNFFIKIAFHKLVIVS